MTIIVPPPAEAHDVGQIVAEIRPVSSKTRLAAESRRRLIACLASGALHGAALVGVICFAAEISATAFQVQQGQASVELAASVAAESRYVPETVSEVVPEKPVYEQQVVELFEPQETVLEKTSPTPEPTLTAAETVVSLAEAGIAVQPPQQQQQPEDQPQIENSPPVPIKRAPVEALARPNPKAEGLDSLDNMASVASQANEGAEVDTLPSPYASNPAPPYPIDALQAGLEGRVVLRVVVNPLGTPDDVSIDRSSGVNSLDSSALATVRRWRFVPARRSGLAVSIVVRVPVRFTIRDAFRG